MIRHAIALTALVSLAGCGAQWVGEETVNIAPTSVADAQLIPTTPEETVVVAPGEASSTPTIVSTEAALVVAPVDNGAFSVAPVAVADAALIPSAPTGVVNVAPTTPESTSELVPVVVANPAPLPPRPSSGSDANLVAFALETSHPVGQSVYPRSAGSVDALACGGYRSPVAAQEAFLAAGGPQSDRLGLDPDGDGYACAWDPSPYRQVTGG